MKAKTKHKNRPFRMLGPMEFLALRVMSSLKGRQRMGSGMLRREMGNILKPVRPNGVNNSQTHTTIQRLHSHGFLKPRKVKGMGRMRYDYSLTPEGRKSYKAHSRIFAG